MRTRIPPFLGQSIMPRRIIGDHNNCRIFIYRNTQLYNKRRRSKRMRYQALEAVDETCDQSILRNTSNPYSGVHRIWWSLTKVNEKRSWSISQRWQAFCPVHSEITFADRHLSSHPSTRTSFPQFMLQHVSSFCRALMAVTYRDWAAMNEDEPRGTMNFAVRLQAKLIFFIHRHKDVNERMENSLSWARMHASALPIVRSICSAHVRWTSHWRCVDVDRSYLYVCLAKRMSSLVRIQRYMFLSDKNSCVYGVTV